MSYVVITPRTDYPLTLDGVKDFLQETENDNDALINLLIGSATDWVEQRTSRCLMTTDFEQRLQCWPRSNIVKIRWNPVQTVASVKYVDANEVEQTINSTNYATWTRDHVLQISFNDDYQWPTTAEVPDAFKIRYTSGYNPAYTIPDPIKEAMLLRIRRAYDKRMDDVQTGKMASDHLLEPFIIYL